MVKIQKEIDDTSISTHALREEGDINSEDFLL